MTKVVYIRCMVQLTKFTSMSYVDTPQVYSLGPSYGGDNGDTRDSFQRIKKIRIVKGWTEGWKDIYANT